MNKKEIIPNDRATEYFSETKDRLIQSHNIMLSTNNTFVDKGQITLCMDNTQQIRSLNISDKLLIATNKKKIKDRLTRLINEAIFTSSLNNANSAKDIVSTKELEYIISNQNQTAKENIEKLTNNFTQSLKERSSKTRTVVSKSGNISLVISGTRIIMSLAINDDYLSNKNKSLIEIELLETVNLAIREIQKEIQEQIMKDEKEFTKKNV